jgi:predicted RNase H-like HicB family nuclease
MKRIQQLTAIIEREGDGYVGLCPEVDIASQGDTIEEARKNLQEAVELFFETADRSEIERRHRIGILMSIIRQSQLARSFFET